jgi:hypothetical protein
MKKIVFMTVLLKKTLSSLVEPFTNWTDSVYLAGFRIVLGAILFYTIRNPDRLKIPLGWTILL